MELQLSPDAEHWLHEQVAQGRFGSLEEAVETLVREDSIAQRELAGTDLAWAKPYLRQGVADIAAGRTVAAEDVHAELRARLKSRAP